MLSCCTTRVRESLQLSLACAAFGHQIAPIIPHISFQLRSGYMNSAPLMCAPSTGNSMGTSDWCMSFDVCESKSCTHSVPRPRFGMAGGVGLLMLYFISVLSFLFVNVLNYWLSAFERETVAGRTFHFFHLPNLPIKFQGMTIHPLIIYIYLIYK